MSTRLQESFGALYAALEHPKVARRVVAVLLVIHTLLLGYSAYVHSPTLNEPGHLVAGLSHWKFGRFELYRVNPPLVKMVAALPVMAVGYEEDWSGFYEGPGARPIFGMGEDFVAANGERSFFLFMIARWACIPFSWIGAIVCYLWARDLYGRSSGVLACTIWCFEPNILAHASLMTPDAHATALGLAACYTFWRWLKNPTWGQAALTGVVLGLAELAKTTLILFYPLWPLMWLFYRWPDRKHTPWLRETGMLGMRMLIGLYVLNLGYGFEGSFTPLKEFHFVSNLFTGEETGNRGQGAGDQQSEVHNAKSINRFANSWLGNLPVPFPKNYLLGIDIQQRDFEDYGRPSYLRGEWRDRGWWYYYLYAVAIKVPLGLWLLGILAIAARFLSFVPLTPDTRHPTPKAAESGGPSAESQNATACFSPTAGNREPIASARDQFILLFPALVIFAVVSSKTGFSEHMRYVLPAFPFFFVWISGIAKKWLTRPKEGCYVAVKPRWRIVRVPLFSASLVAICWLFTSSLAIYPHSLSYFNESIGGPQNGAQHLLGSNVDWGQDLMYVNAIAEEASEPIALAYYGPTNPGLLNWLSSSKPVEATTSTSVSKSVAEPREVKDGLLFISVSLAYGWPDFARCAAKPKYLIPKATLQDILAINRCSLLTYSVYISGPNAVSR